MGPPLLCKRVPRLLGRHDFLAVKFQQNVAGHHTRCVGGTTLMNILKHPSRCPIQCVTLKRRVDGEAGRYLAKAPVEDPSVTRFQLGQKLLDLRLEFLNGFTLQNAGLPGSDEQVYGGSDEQVYGHAHRRR
jgi:hypothetical protein